MYRKADNVFSTILSDVTVATSTLPSAGTVVTDTNLTAGAVVMVDAGMRRTTLATLSDGDMYFIVQGRGAGVPLVKSNAIIKGKETITSQKHVPAQQQITVIGSTGTTGSLPSANDTSYFIKIRKNDNDEANRSQPESLFAQYKTSGSATQEELAFGLARNFVANFARQAESTNGYAAIEVLCDNAGATDGTATTITVTNGSKAGTLNAGATTFVVGDLLRIGGGAVTDEVYEIKTLSGTSVTLDRPYTGATGSGVTIEYITSALAAAANFGLRIVGLEADFDVNKFRNFYSPRFTATFSNEDTVVTHVQGARNGSGVWQAVATDEYMSYGFDGMNEMLATPPTLRDAVVKVPGVGGQTALTSKYSTINIAWTKSMPGLTSNDTAKGNVLIHLNLEDSSGSGILDTATANTGETLAAALGLTPADLDE